MSEAKMVNVTIDGHALKVEEGLPLIDAAARLGIDIPRFCYHPHLSVAGNCRMCAVEVEKARGLPISCATPCAEGLIAKTDTEAVTKHRAAVMEFLLVNHPIDCPICDQAGECSLQIYYMKHDLKPSRLEVEKVHYDKRVPVGPRVVLDQERCVECTRCIRFCDEVTKTGELRMVNRGDRNSIATFPGIPLDNDYSVNVADICPVGALTQKDFRFKARVWFLKEAESLCPGCARGCNVTVDYGWHDIVTDYNGKAYRLRPRVNDAVNQAWMCDFGRTEYLRVNEQRLRNVDAEGRALRTTEVARSAASSLKVSKAGVVLIGSLESTLEEMRALKELGRHLGASKVVCVPDRPDGKDDDLLLRADKHPNRRGAEVLGLFAEAKELPNLLSGKAAIVIHQVDLLAFDTQGSIRKALEKIGTRIFIGANSNATSAVATALLAGVSFLEKDGHWINFEGRVQRLRRAQKMKPAPGTADDVAILAALSENAIKTTASEHFAALTDEVPALSGWTSETAGLQGRTLGPIPGVPV